MKVRTGKFVEEFAARQTHQNAVEGPRRIISAPKRFLGATETNRSRILMKHIDLVPLGQAAKTDMDRLIGHLAEWSLVITLQTTLATLKGSHHFHIKHHDHRTGTLELTFDPVRGRIFVSVHKNRDAPWISEAMERMKSMFEDTNESHPAPKPPAP